MLTTGPPGGGPAASSPFGPCDAGSARGRGMITLRPRRAEERHADRISRSGSQASCVTRCARSPGLRGPRGGEPIRG